ncbi:MAG TPA: aspartate kinase [Niabella sp.]|nr:aspartate kinase [Niabella sp.]HOZ95765.1 aspartate kinase [Niabella sp.]HQW13619.1 aspartate kinase [Niabella sp.]HQX19013.1 aspartate kinase [Niabella sp.]HQX40845.1 aspartate kinase [Niabella sp.]
MIKVFKFGGASVNSVDRIRHVSNILQAYKGQPLLIVISAMGKTTNALEKVAEAFYKHEKDEALQLFDEVKKIHLTTANHLLTKQFAACERQLRDLFTEVEWLLHDRPVKPFDFYYDQIVCVGELLSTTIISFYLNEDGLTNQWVDVRDIIRTDSNFRDANIDWKYTEQRTEELVKPVLSSGEMVLTQGFIGATHENESTTLGREGSDFTAAVFSNLLDAESQTIWKDVASVMNADPREIKDALPLPELNYNEVIEMAYYGAQVIHPKTIKPLQNKGIPLLVKCFLNADLPGTIIHNNAIPPLPPIVMVKKNQVMITLRSKDFSFIGDHNTEELYQLLKRLFLTPTLTQNGAIKIIYAFDNREEKLKELVAEAGKSFDVQIMSGLTLLTIRHYNDEALNRFVANKDFLVRQQTAQHICLLYLEQGL